MRFPASLIDRALMSEPRLLIMDKPSLGLSPRRVDDMFALIDRSNREDHRPAGRENVVRSLAIVHRGYVLENGAVTLGGMAAERAKELNLKRSGA